jgi:hypothetical protein
MAEITKTEITVVEDNFGKVENGTGRRRATVHIRGTTASTGDTLDLSTYLLSGVSGIEGPRVETVDEAVAATASTWTGTTLTFAGHTGSGRYAGEWVVFH